MKAGFWNVESLHCQLTKQKICHDFTVNKMYFNFWIEVTHLLKYQIETRQL